LSATAERLLVNPVTDTRSERPSWVRAAGGEARLNPTEDPSDGFMVGEPSQTPARPGQASVLSFVTAAEGVLVEDVLGAVYGVGPSADAALVDYFVALDQRLRLLREKRGALHPRLAWQLQRLEGLFPGR
jgi:hypothetical protein